MKVKVSCIKAIIAERLDASVYKEHNVTIPANGIRNLSKLKPTDFIPNLENPAFIVTTEKCKKSVDIDKSLIKLGE